jgi:ribonuclease P protein component
VAKQFTLGKNERLKSRKRIEQLFSTGKAFTLFPFRIFYLPGQPADPVLQFGAAVSTKNFKKAVDRNRIKRLLREAWRLQKNSLQLALKEQNTPLSVFLIYTAKELPDYKVVFEKTGKIIDKLSANLELKK